MTLLLLACPSGTSSLLVDLNRSGVFRRGRGRNSTRSASDMVVLPMRKRDDLCRRGGGKRSSTSLSSYEIGYISARNKQDLSERRKTRPAEILNDTVTNKRQSVARASLSLSMPMCPRSISHASAPSASPFPSPPKKARKKVKSVSPVLCFDLAVSCSALGVLL
nr:hypothetical protein CFP56_28600 [Quercus suber]